jgi:tetratricopeptide (TPR) repeat protein
VRFEHALASLVTVVTLGWTISAGQASAAALWSAVARAPEREAANERRQAFAEVQRLALGGSDVGDHATKGAGSQARAETHLRRALNLFPADFEARRQLGELYAANGRPRDAAREFEGARRMAPTPLDEARVWFRIANERSRFAAYDEALDAYSRALAFADPEPTALNNSGELLMALGRLGEAIDRYREAIAIEERERDRRSHIQGLALGTFGLAVALDRDGRAVAADEAMGRAPALDAGLSVLRLAEQGSGDLFFVPPGDVFYYLGLARQAQDRTDDAAAAFRNYLRSATGPYARRARDHLARLERDRANRRSPAAARTPEPARGVRLRVIHEATLVADGPLVAPLIDAAWRLDPGLLDACLSDVVLTGAAGPGDEPAAAPRGFKLSLELNIDDSGRVTAVKVDAPPALPSDVASCIDSAVRTRLRVSRPTRRKPTRAHVELVLARAEPSGV